MQHIEDRIKRNFDNRVSQKTDIIENAEQDVRETEEQLEDVLTESQIAVAANINNKSNEPEIEDKCQEKAVVNESSDINVVDNTAEENSSVVDNDSGEKGDEDQNASSISEIQNKIALSSQTIHEQNNVIVENTNEEIL